MVFGEKVKHGFGHGFGLFREQGMTCIMNLDDFNLLRAFLFKRVSIFGRGDFILHGLDNEHGNAARAVPAIIPVPLALPCAIAVLVCQPRFQYEGISLPSAKKAVRTSFIRER